ncbi:MAG: DNA primase [Rhodocyclaceae bacterium]
MIPQSFVQDLLARIDIVDLIERYLPLKKGGANYFACCPFHGEKSPSFSVSPTKQFYHCFGCGAHGSAIGFLMEYSGLSFVEAVKELASQVGMQVPEEERGHRPPQADNSSLTDTMARAASFYRQQLRITPRAIDYLKRRGLTGEIAARFGIGYAPDGWQPLEAAFPAYQDKSLLDTGLVIENEQGRRYDRFRDRIMFPIQDQRGNIIAFGGRILDKGEPKYLNSPETALFEKGRELYGQVQARRAIREHETVIVVEGYMDVVALAQFGVENAVATLGTATTPSNVQRLLRMAERVVFCFDGDNAGRKAAWRALESALEHLADNRTVAFLFLPAEHDPDSFVRENGAEAFQRAAGSATPLAEFLLQELVSQTDTASAEGRARLVHDARPLVTRIAAPVLRLQVIKSLAERAGMMQTEIEQAYGLKSAPRTQREGDGERFGRRGRSAIMPRRKPSSSVEKLLRMVLMQPTWAGRVPIDLVPDDSDEGAALIAIVDMYSIGELPMRGGIGPLLEQFRDTPHEQVLARSARTMDDASLDESVDETVFADTLHKLHTESVNKEFEALTEKARNTTLSAEERRRYADLLLERRNPGDSPKISDS